MPKPAITPLSAVIAFRNWMDTYGRLPHARECRSENNLPHHDTIRHLFSGIPGITRLANSLSAGDFQMWMDSSKLLPLKERRCLVCGEIMHVHGDIWRHDRCRKACAVQGDMTPVLTRNEVKQFGLAEDGEY